MANDSGPLVELGKVIPSIYYDLIARVGAGVPFLVILFWDRKEFFSDPSWAKIGLLVGAGYVTGLLLTPISFLWSPIGWAVAKILGAPTDWKRGSYGNDEVSRANAEAGATLAKMQAEATLCLNLFSGFLLLNILNACWRIIPAVNENRSLSKWVLLLLAVAVIFRVTAYLGRQKQLHGLYCGR
jgi:hypothetical protein